MDFIYGRKNMTAAWTTSLQSEDEVAVAVTEKPRKKLPCLEKDKVYRHKLRNENTEACELYLKGEILFKPRRVCVQRA